MPMLKIFLKTCFDFFLLFLGNSLNIFYRSKTVSVFFQTMKVFMLCIFEKHYYILIIVKINKKVFLCLFVLICKYLTPYVTLHCRHPYHNMNHLINFWFHLNFGSQILHCLYAKFNIYEVSFINNLLN